MTINKWLSVFAKDVDKRLIKKHVTSEGNFLWHIFTYGNVPCLEGDEARKAFDALDYTEAIKFTDGYSNRIKNKGIIGRLSAEEVDNAPEGDVYIVARDMSWTYVRTHEEGLCGPYFCIIK
ncbi:MAG: DUF4275 family protein [Clostridia bacterium]|nr:DUF4275 family protein [Clostridia bacterium]